MNRIKGQCNLLHNSKAISQLNSTQIY